MTSLLIYDSNNFTPSGIFCYYKEKVKSEETVIMPTITLKKLYNLYRYIQHLILKSEYDDDDDELDHSLDEENWYCKLEENT